MNNARYNVLTWDPVAGQYTEQDGLESPCLGVDIHGLRRCLHELRNVFGYSAFRLRTPDGDHISDSNVLVERVDCDIVDAMDFEEHAKQ